MLVKVLYSPNYKHNHNKVCYTFFVKLSLQGCKLKSAALRGLPTT